MFSRVSFAINSVSAYICRFGLVRDMPSSENVLNTTLECQDDPFFLRVLWTHPYVLQRKGKMQREVTVHFKYWHCEVLFNIIMTVVISKKGEFIILDKVVITSLSKWTAYFVPHDARSFCQPHHETNGAHLNFFQKTIQ
jgi:hypothetical protein